MKMNDADIIIIGAGAAGLAAAETLHRDGRRILILEARDRIGGRVHTVRDPHWPAPLEFGAEFIHGRPAETWDIVHQENLQAYDVADTHWGSDNGKPRKQSAEWPHVETIMSRLNRVTDHDISFVEFLEQHCADVSPAARAMAKAFVEGLDAADSNTVSSKSLLNSEKDGETFAADMPFRLFNGYDRVLEHLLKTLPAESIRLKTVVKAVRWAPGQVSVEAEDGRQFNGKRLLLTLPIGVLRAAPGERGAVAFRPPLPTLMRSAIDRMRMGPVIKVLLRFRSAWWERGDWRDLSFLHAPEAAFPTWWTTLPVRTPVLTAWAGGPAAEALSKQLPADVVDAAIKTLAELVGVDVATINGELAAWHVSDWQTDPFARGAYAFATVGGSDAVQQLGQPIEGTIFIAGEATHPGYAGTVAAAIASGRRAASQVVAASSGG